MGDSSNRSSQINTLLTESLGYGWAICGLALTPMTAKKAEEPVTKKVEKKTSNNF